MPDEIKPTTETVEAKTETVPATVEKKEKEEEVVLGSDGKPFDPERAAKTIHDQRIENKELKEKLKELEQLKAEKKQREDAELSEAERLKKERDEMAAENAKIKSDLLRREAVDAAGLPATWADRIKGSTKEELFADAEELAKSLPQTKVAPKVPATNPSNATQDETDAQIRTKLFGGATRLDNETIKRLGGGVVWNIKKE